MSRICTGLRISLLLLLLPFFSIAQSARFDTAGFYNHLVRNNLLREQLAFNKQWMQWHKSNIKLADSSFLNNAIAFYRLNCTDSSYADLLKISPCPDFTIHSEQLYLSMLILQANLSKAATELNGVKTIFRNRTYYNDDRLSLLMLKHEKIDTATEMPNISERMKEIQNDYEKTPRHSAFVAGISSAIVPGLGRLYLGYKYQAISAFIANVFLGGQTIESYLKAGPSSARFIVSASLFGLFYGGNIWGSIFAARKQKHDHLKQIDYEILDFHNAIVGKSGR